MGGSGTGKLVIGLVMIAVAMIVFPLVLSAAHTIMNDANIGDFTGLDTLVAITPLLLWIGLIFGGGLLAFQGVRARRGGRRARASR